LDGYAIDDDFWPEEPEDSGWELAATLTLPSGEAVRVQERDVTCGEPGRVDVHYRFELADGRVIDDVLRHQAFSWATLQMALRDAGFRHADVAGGFEGEPFHEASELMVIAAER